MNLELKELWNLVLQNCLFNYDWEFILGVFSFISAFIFFKYSFIFYKNASSLQGYVNGEISNELAFYIL